MTDWISKLRKGDVIRSRSGRLRIVRRVHRWDKGNGLRTCVTLAIQHCSWTHRPYTVYNDNDLRQMGYEPVRARIRLNTKFDKTLERDFAARNSSECEFDCSAVKGVA